MERIIVYIDGFNLYFGLRQMGWKKYYWLDIQKLSHSLLAPGQVLNCVKYFTSKVSNPIEKRKRQEAYLSALTTLSKVEQYYGKYRSQPETCRKCGTVRYVPHEKRTDVNIATQMLIDTFQNNYDTAILISADSDLTEPLIEIQRLFPEKYVKVAFPPGRFSSELKASVGTSFQIFESKVKKSLFPPKVTLPSGYIIQCPDEWR